MTKRVAGLGVLSLLLLAACQEGRIDPKGNGDPYWGGGYAPYGGSSTSFTSYPLDALNHQGILAQGYDVYLAQDGARVDVASVPADPNRPLLRDTFLKAPSDFVTQSSYEDLRGLQQVNEPACVFETKETVASVSACGDNRCLAVRSQGRATSANCQQPYDELPDTETLTVAGPQLQLPRPGTTPRVADLVMAGGATWTAVTGDGPAAVSGARSAVANGTGYVAGLAGSPAAFAVYAYDFKAHAWSVKTPATPPKVTRFGAVAWAGGTLYAVGDAGAAKWQTSGTAGWEALSWKASDFVTAKTDQLFVLPYDDTTLVLARLETPEADAAQTLSFDLRSVAAAGTHVGAPPPTLTLPTHSRLVGLDGVQKRLYAHVRSAYGDGDTIFTYDPASNDWQTTGLQRTVHCAPVTSGLACLGASGYGVLVTDGARSPASLPASHVLYDWDKHPLTSLGDTVAAWGSDAAAHDDSSQPAGDGVILDTKTGRATALPERSESPAPVARFAATLLFDGSSLVVWGGCRQYGSDDKCQADAIGGAATAVYAR